ncbi:S8 family peptidase [Streptomyces sp. NBC_00090]|uniref:S8 family serine peptidase n=1 Tax=Streptomyces sp. NBC_00090 TaxID=2903619 RepID=UPI0032520CD1
MRLRGRLHRKTTAGAAATVLLALAGTGLAAAPAQADEGTLVGAGRPGAIAGAYIVTLADGTRPADVPGLARTLSGRHGGSLGHVYTAALNGFSVRLPEAAARRLAAEPGVVRVEADGIATIAGTQPSPPSWGLDRIDQNSLPLNSSYTYPNTGSGVNAYVIDTGVRLTHQDFGGRAVSGYDFVDGDADASDCQGHGTHVAGTVGGASYGVAKAAKIVSVRVLDCNGQAPWSTVIKGIDWVTANAVKPAVANVSIGGSTDQTVNDAVARSIAAGITYAVAGGNSNANACSSSPASLAAAITVGATDRNDARASYSNYGSCLDLFAPGSDIVSASNSGNSTSTGMSGTSMAAPHVAGAAALLLSAAPGLTPQQVRDQLVANAATGKVTNPGSGSANRLLTVGGGTTTPPPTGPKFENTADYAVRDNATVDSPVTVSGVGGAAPAALAVTVDIRHTWRGDLRLQLIAPDGSAYLLKDYNANDSADNVQATYTVNASSETADGVWKLRVTDNAVNDTGTLNAWNLQF